MKKVVTKTKISINSSQIILLNLMQRIFFTKISVLAELNKKTCQINSSFCEVVKISLVIGFVFRATMLQAQQSENIVVPTKYASGIVMGLNVNLLIPVGVLANRYSAGFGGGITAKYIFDGKIGLGAIFNYQLLAPRNPGGFNNYTAVNYGGVIEYYLNKTGAFTPYFGLEVVAFDFVTNFGSGTGATGNSFSSKDTFFSGVGVCPNIGFAIQVNKFVDTNINFKYNHILSNGGITSQIITISAGLIFHITKD